MNMSTSANILKTLNTPSLVIKIILLLIIIFLFVGTDLLVKYSVYENLKGQPDIIVIPGFWSFRYQINNDIGFSILRFLNKIFDKNQKILFIILLQSLGTILIAGFYFYSKPLNLLIPLSLIICGGLGNVINRIILGYVIDYVMWYYNDFIWPIFNLADVYTICGASLFFIIMLFFSKKLYKK